MTYAENIPVKNDSKDREIKRLTSPLEFKHGRAYDVDGNVVESVETLREFRHYIEPKPGILTEDEILKYARNSRAASQIRMNRGIATLQDKFMVNQNLPWYFGMYYVVLACLSVPILYYASAVMAIVLIALAVIPIIYSLYRVNIKKYPYIPPENQIDGANMRGVSKGNHGISSLKGYEKKIKELSQSFDLKEKEVRELIEKRFEPPQMTYDRFISSVDSCNKIFYTHADAALNIVNLASVDTQAIRDELDDKIDSLESIIEQIENLKNELIINMNSNPEDDDDLKRILEKMEQLTDSVKEY